MSAITKNHKKIAMTCHQSPFLYIFCLKITQSLKAFINILMTLILAECDGETQRQEESTVRRFH